MILLSILKKVGKLSLSGFVLHYTLAHISPSVAGTMIGLSGNISNGKNLECLDSFTQNHILKRSPDSSVSPRERDG